MLLFLTWMLPGQSTAQFKTPKRDPVADSLAVIRQLAGNAKPILDSLTQLHFLRGEYRALQQRFQESRANLAAGHERLTASLSQQEQYGQQVVQLTYEGARLRRRLDRARLELWLWRTGAAVGIYLKVRPMFR